MGGFVGTMNEIILSKQMQIFENSQLAVSRPVGYLQMHEKTGFSKRVEAEGEINRR